MRSRTTASFAFAPVLLIAAMTAQIHNARRASRLSYADCSCLALAKLQVLPSLTGDRQCVAIPPVVEIWEQHVRRPRFQQVERPHWDKGLFTSRVYFL